MESGSSAGLCFSLTLCVPPDQRVVDPAFDSAAGKGVDARDLGAVDPRPAPRPL